MSELLKGKNILIMGIRNKWSIAWGIAQAAKAQGANLIFTYLGDREKESLQKLTSGMGEIDAYPCDVANEEDIDSLFSTIKSKYGVLHGLVHAIAFAKSEDLQDTFVNTSKDGFLVAMDISVFSFITVAKRAQALMTDGGSILTLTYRGSVKVSPGYNIMGVAKAALEASVRYAAADLARDNIRAFALSAGPIRTRAASGIAHFDELIDRVRDRTPSHQLVSIEEVGRIAAFLASEAAAPMSGSVIYADNSFHLMA